MPRTGNWGSKPGSWPARERLEYEAKGPPFFRGRIVWEFQKPNNDGFASIEARASVNLPLKSEKRWFWQTRFSVLSIETFDTISDVALSAASPEAIGAQGGFESLLERSSDSATQVYWKALASGIELRDVVNASGSPPVSFTTCAQDLAQTPRLLLSYPGHNVIYNAFQVPLLLRVLLGRPGVGEGAQFVILAGRRFHGFRIRKGQAAKVGGDEEAFIVESAPFKEQRNGWSVNWSEAKSGELIWDLKNELARLIRVKIPLFGSINIQLTDHSVC